jgi:hypothetical protein
LDLKEESILGPRIKDHWYYVAKGRALRALVGRETVPEVLDVGAGSGVFTRQLLDAGVAERGVCVDPGYERERVETHNGRQIAFRRQVRAVPQKLILMMDVLEHVDDDLGLLRQYSDEMPADARLLITVPAFQFLWSGHDVFLDHRRRYTLPQVEALVGAAGLRILSARYFFGALFPIVAAMRLIDRLRLKAGAVAARSQLRPMARFANRALIAVHDIERAALFPFNRLAGLTVFCLVGRGG